MPFLSVITPIYNSTKTLRAYLDAIFISQYQDFELIIVDDYSDDFPQDILKDYKVVYKKLDCRSGSACARNIGVEIARAELVVFLDSDVVVPPTVLGDIVEAFKVHPEIAGLIGSYDDAPGGKNLISQFKFLFHHYIHQQEAEYIDSFWSGCGAIKKEVFNSLDGFNASYLEGNSIHDIELGYRLKKNGYKIYNAKRVQVKHLKELGLFEWAYTDVCVRGVPWILIMLVYQDWSLKLNANVKSIISLLCVGGVLVLLGGVFINRIFVYGLMGVLVLFLMVNWGLLRFFMVRKNIPFSIISIFFLFIYYINGGICVLVGSSFMFKNMIRDQLIIIKGRYGKRVCREVS